MGIQFTSFEMSSIVNVLGFSPDAVMMNLMRYAKHGLLNRKREGHEYYYRTNERTERAYMYFFGGHPPFVVRARLPPGEYFPVDSYNSLLVKRY